MCSPQLVLGPLFSLAKLKQLLDRLCELAAQAGLF